MNAFSKKRLTTWSIVVLVLLNLVTMGTLWYRETVKPHLIKQKRWEQEQLKLEKRLQTEVGLTQKQIETLFEQREDFISKLEKKKKERIWQIHKIVNAAFSEHPDMEQIKAWTLENGASEAASSMLFFEHMRRIRSIARPEQKEKLHQLFNNLFQENRPREKTPPDVTEQE